MENGRKRTERETLPLTFVYNCKKYSKKAFLIYKDRDKWREISWHEAYIKTRDIALGLMALGVCKGERVSVLSQTNPELAFCCTAVAAAGAVFNPLYPTLSSQECLQILSDVESKIVMVEDEYQLSKVMEIWDHCPKIEKVILFGLNKFQDERIMSLSELTKKGLNAFKDNPDDTFLRRIKEVEPSDISAIIYTSGTTGDPKGVMLTDEGFIRHFNYIGKIVPFSNSDRAVSYLPMAHLLELMDGHWRHVYFGYTQVYARSIKTVYEDIIETKPTLIWNTPRFYEKLYKALTKEVEKFPKPISNFLKNFMVENDSSIFEKHEQGTINVLKTWIAKKLLRSLLHKLIGKNVKFASCGGAPIVPALLKFFEFCGLPMYEAYGLTESHGLVATNRPGALKIGTVGKPVEGVELKFGSDGEILVKGPFRCKGYWKKEDLTAELFRDGWLHTGDIGFLDEDGFLHLTGRKKDIIVTSSGHNIAPAKIENLLKTNPLVNEVVVVGHGKDHLSAVIFPNREELEEFAKERDIKYTTFEELVEEPEILSLFEKEIETVNEGLPGVEKIKRFKLIAREFRPEDEEVTPTMKIKRHVFEKKYRELIESLYE